MELREGTLLCVEQGVGVGVGDGVVEVEVEGVGAEEGVI